MLPRFGQPKNLIQLRSVPWVLTIELTERASSDSHLSVQGNFFTIKLVLPYFWRKLKHGNILLGSHGSNMNNSAPAVQTYNFNPKHDEKSTSRSGAPTGAIVGSAIGAVVLVLITLALVCMSLLRTKRYASRQSETGSSDHSIQVVWAKHPDSPLVVGRGPAFPEVVTARRFTLAELEHATKQWNSTNLIGVGRFGLVYKGLLEDGTIVAIKKRKGFASQEFAAEVDYLAHVRHKNLVILIGFCQEDDEQMVVYDYLPNGNVNSHLYDDSGRRLGKLDFKQRLSIALGAARGLEHLHALVPPLIHTDFKTSDVLVDENFVPKVTDFGITRLLTGEQELPPSTSRVHTPDFQDPELLDIQVINEKSDVYSFGVFLLEMISGREAITTSKPEPEGSLVEWAQFLWKRHDLGALVDYTMGGRFTEEAIKATIEVAFMCIELMADKRLSMKDVVNDLQKIMDMESGFTSGVERLASVALGSELFSRTA
eukprot:c19904_g2_i1 orf=284-1735(+)